MRTEANQAPSESCDRVWILGNTRDWRGPYDEWLSCGVIACLVCSAQGFEDGADATCHYAHVSITTRTSTPSLSRKSHRPTPGPQRSTSAGHNGLVVVRWVVEGGSYPEVNLAAEFVAGESSAHLRTGRCLCQVTILTPCPLHVLRSVHSRLVASAVPRCMSSPPSIKNQV